MISLPKIPFRYTPYLYSAGQPMHAPDMVFVVMVFSKYDWSMIVYSDWSVFFGRPITLQVGIRYLFMGSRVWQSGDSVAAVIHLLLFVVVPPVWLKHTNERVHDPPISVMVCVTVCDGVCDGVCLCV